MLLAFAVRALGFEAVFVGDHVVFPPADAQYHLRRALYTFANFPDILLFDAYINYPGGAPIPWPPLYDFTIASVARLLAEGVHGFEVVVAWVPPLLGALAILPIHLSGRRLDSPALGLIAGLFFALLPIHVWLSRVGNVDHHAAVAAIGAWLLLAWIRAIDPEESKRSLWSSAALLFAARSCMLLTWPGSLLYLAIADGLLLATAALGGRIPTLWVELFSSAACAVLLVPILLVMPKPLGGDYSAIALSRLHLIAVLATALVSGGLLVAEQRRPGRGAAGRLGRLMLLATGCAAFVWLLPGPRAGLEPALRFMTMTDAAGRRTGEQIPLFRFEGRMVGFAPEYSWGYYAYLIPVVPFAAWWLLRRPGARAAARAAALPLAAWGGCFAVLTVSQQRYGNDFAPAASLLFATLLLGVGRAAAFRSSAKPGRGRRAMVIASLFCVALYWPPMNRVYLPGLKSSLAALETGPPPLARTSVAATLADFCREVRALTPETSSYLEPGPDPEYGIVAPANLGHALHYAARRPTATDPFWAYIGRENWDRSLAFQASRSEPEALELAAALKGRFVVTVPGATRGTIVAQLHERDGGAGFGRGALEHFRLLTEGPSNGASLQAIAGRGSGGFAPYKLFEIVRGAVVEVRAEPGQTVTAEVSLVTPRGRSFRYRNRAIVGEDGAAHVVLPYPTDGSPTAPVASAQEPYRLRVGTREHVLHVNADAVEHGERIRLGPGGGPGG